MPDNTQNREQIARDQIDAKPVEAGWCVQTLSTTSRLRSAAKELPCHD
jgi:hypothetical protein